MGSFGEGTQTYLDNWRVLFAEINCHLQSLYQESELRAVVLELHAESIVKNEILGLIYSTYETDYFFNQALRLLDGLLLERVEF